jgi:hypothetical protein
MFPMLLKKPNPVFTATYTLLSINKEPLGYITIENFPKNREIARREQGMDSISRNPDMLQNWMYRQVPRPSLLFFVNNCFPCRC